VLRNEIHALCEGDLDAQAAEENRIKKLKE
jgi:hypothetical protein